MGYKTVRHTFAVCDWCQHEEEYDSRCDPTRALPEWLLGRWYYKTGIDGESPVTLCPDCRRIYEVATEANRTPRGARFRTHMQTFFECEEIIKRANPVEDDDDDFLD